MLKIQKAFSLKGTVSEKDNTLSGMASPIGRIDRGGDVPFPGCFQAVLGDFLKSGFVPVGHDWEDLPVAYPTEAYEGQGPGGYGLHSTCKFHSTQKAQDARTVSRERLEAGLDVGLSVGMILNSEGGYQWFESGAKLLEFAAANGHDMSLFDTKSVNAYARPCRGLMKVTELFEYSIVTVPMAQAGAYAVKNFDLQGHPLSGMSLKDHLADLLSRVADGTQRVIQTRNQRQTEGRDLSPERKAQAMTMIDDLKSLEGELKATVLQLANWIDEDPAEQPEGTVKRASERDRDFRLLQAKARMLGVQATI